MSKRSFRLIFMIAMVIVVAGCAARHNSSGRVGTGPLSRSEAAFNNMYGIMSAGTTMTPNSPMDVANFFSNYLNSDGTLFQLPCTVTQINVSANSAPGAQLHLDFILGCVGNDPVIGHYGDIRVDIADGTNGYAGTSSSVSGGYATVNFSDEYGTITLSGPVGGGSFQATATYSNNYYYGTNGMAYSPGFSGTLGQFQIQCIDVFPGGC